MKVSSAKRTGLKSWQKGFGILTIAFILLVIAISTAHAGGCCDVVKSGLVACYPFDGNANDVGGNNINGIENGNLKYIAGRSGQTSQFDGIDSYISLGTDSRLKMENAVTITVWVKPYSFPSNSPTATDMYRNILSDHSPTFDDGKILRFHGNHIEFLMDAEGTTEVGYSWTDADVWNFRSSGNML